MDEARPEHARAVLVAVKHVPVGGAFLRIDGGELTREGVSHGLDPLNEVALEWAIRAREEGAVQRVIAFTMGPPAAVDALRRALAMGADDTILVSDPALQGADVRTTARIVAAVARRTDADLVLTGYESLDGSSGAVPAAVAALLGVPLVSRFNDGTLEGAVLRGRRDVGSGPESIEVDAPAVISFVEGHVTPRYPKLKDVLRTKAAMPTTLSAADLGVDVAPGEVATVGLVEAPSVAKEARVVGLEEGVESLFAMLTSTGAAQ